MKVILLLITSFSITTNSFANDEVVNVKININDERLSYEIENQMENATKKRFGCYNFDIHNGWSLDSRFATPTKIGEDLYAANEVSSYCGFRANGFSARVHVNNRKLSDMIYFGLEHECKDLDIDSATNTQQISIYCTVNEDPRYIRQLYCDPMNDLNSINAKDICSTVKKVNIDIKLIRKDEADDYVNYLMPTEDLGRREVQKNLSNTLNKFYDCTLLSAKNCIQLGEKIKVLFEQEPSLFENNRVKRFYGYNSNVHSKLLHLDKHFEYADKIGFDSNFSIDEIKQQILNHNRYSFPVNILEEMSKKTLNEILLPIGFEDYSCNPEVNSWSLRKEVEICRGFHNIFRSLVRTDLEVMKLFGIIEILDDFNYYKMTTRKGKEHICLTPDKNLEQVRSALLRRVD